LSAHSASKAGGVNMKKNLMIAALCVFSVNSFSACEDIVYKDKGPFSVTSATGNGNKIYENLRNIDDHKIKTHFLPNEAIVLDITGDDYEEIGNYRPIEVLSSPSRSHFDRLRRSRNFFKSRGSLGTLAYAASGINGYLYKKSIKKASNYSYLLKDQGMVVRGQAPSDLLVLKPKVSSSGKFATCGDSRYLFEVTVKKASEDVKVPDATFDMDSSFGLSLVKNLVALPNSTSRTLIQIFHYLQEDANLMGYGAEDLDYIHSLKLMRFPYDEETFEGPYNSYYYNPDNGGHDDRYLNLLSSCALLNAVKTFEDKYGDGENVVMIGDMFHHTDWKEHKSHGGEGRCIDLRPMRKDGKVGKLTYSSTGIYDQKQTINLIKVLKESGGTSIYFNDPRVISAVSGVSSVSGHHNHIHVCYKDTEKVRNSCYSN
jgi:hypothetical protein